MKKLLVLLSFALQTMYAFGQSSDLTIGINVINDEATLTNKSFALKELIAKKKYSNTDKTLSPVLVDYIYASPYGLEGTFKKNGIVLMLYKDAKNVAKIECENKWKTLIEKLDAELEKIGFKASEKVNKVDEGIAVEVYDNKMQNNLPGNLTIKTPQNLFGNDLKIQAAFSFFKPKNVYNELKNLQAISVADITETKFFKFNDIPKQLKEVIKPLAYPISKTPILTINYIGYGNILLQENDFLGAQHCYLQALVTSKELLTSEKDKAIIRAFILEKLAYIQPKLSENRKMMANLYAFCGRLNTAILKNNNLLSDHLTYYKNIDQVKSVCIKAEENAKAARGARFGMIMGAVTQGINSAGVNMGADMSSLTQSMQSVDLLTSKSVEMMTATTRMTADLKNIAVDIKSDQFISDAGGTSASKSLLAAEVLYFINQYPEDIKKALLAYSADKVNLKKAVDQFYLTTDKLEQQNILKQLYVQLAKIEAAITNFEVRELPVSEKYLSSF